MTEFQIYALDANSLRVSVCRDTKDFTNQQGRGKFQVSFLIEILEKNTSCGSQVSSISMAKSERLLSDIKNDLLGSM